MPFSLSLDHSSCLILGQISAQSKVDETREDSQKYAQFVTFAVIYWLRRLIHCIDELGPLRRLCFRSVENLSSMYMDTDVQCLELVHAR